MATSFLDKNKKVVLLLPESFNMSKLDMGFIHQIEGKEIAS